MTIITNINMGRALTPAEVSARETALTNAVAANTVYAFGGTSGFEVAAATSADNGPEIIIWTTTDAANTYVTGANAFTPPPISATVQTI